MCSMSHMADVKTIIQLVPKFVQCVPSDESYGSCDSPKWILGNGYSAGWFHVKLCEMHIAQLLQTLSSLTAEHTNSSAVGQPFSKLVASSGEARQ
jgi:Zn-dependent oligopeptidase